MHGRTAAFRSVAFSRLGIIPAALALAAGTPAGLAQNVTPDGVAVPDQDLVELHVNKEDLTTVLKMLGLQSERNSPLASSAAWAAIL